MINLGFNSYTYGYLLKFYNGFPCKEVRTPRSKWTNNGRVIIVNDIVLKKENEEFLYDGETVITTYLAVDGVPIKNTKWTVKEVYNYLKFHYVCRT